MEVRKTTADTRPALHLREEARIRASAPTRVAVSPTRRPTAVRHAAPPVTVTIRATPLVHGLSSNVKNSTTSFGALRAPDASLSERRANARRHAEEPPNVRRRVPADPDATRVPVALDHVLIRGANAVTKTRMDTTVEGKEDTEDARRNHWATKGAPNEFALDHHHRRTRARSARLFRPRPLLDRPHHENG
jgi:hypothetical protein